MKFEIKSRWTAAVVFECELEASFETESHSVQLGAAVKLAVKARAYLADAYLAGADLAGAYLAGADLAGADLAGAKYKGPKPVGREAAIANLDKVREIILDNQELLYMGVWHADNGWKERTCAEEAVCGTTHCLAGWLQVCATDPEVRKLEPQFAGFVQAPVAAKMFFRGNSETLEWLRERKYATE